MEGKILASGKTLVVEHGDSVVKVFNTPIDNEIVALTTIKSDYIIKIRRYTLNPPTIVYNKIRPLKTIDICDIDTLRSQLFDIAQALNDIHSYGYIHGDVAIGNIGIDEQGRYILYDFEFCKKSSSSEDRFRDVDMFLDDFIIQYRDFPDCREYLKKVKKMLYRLRKVETVQRKVLGKIVYRDVVEYNYKIGDFISILDSI